jgi:hypothetical protein
MTLQSLGRATRSRRIATLVKRAAVGAAAAVAVLGGTAAKLLRLRGVRTRPATDERIKKVAAAKGRDRGGRVSKKFR